MQTDLHKHAIRTAFGNAANHYDSVAHIQRRIADALLARCAPTSGMALDAGCGTGYAMEKLQTLSPSCVALDHAVPMLLRVQHSSICGDIEALPLRTASVALYYSSLAWQWTNASRSIAEAARVLQPGGQFMVATLGPATLGNLREAFRRADDAEHVRQFAPAETYASQLSAAEFENIVIDSLSFVAHAPDFRSILRDIKTLGAHVIDSRRPRGLFGLRGFRRAEAYYENLREDAGLPVFYDAVFITARRT
jgi:malonyl-CoA O-methyltransferase